MLKGVLKSLKEKSKEDLRQELQKEKDRLWQLKVDLRSGKVKNIREVRRVKKLIAAIHTILNQ